MKKVILLLILSGLCGNLQADKYDDVPPDIMREIVRSSGSLHRDDNTARMNYIEKSVRLYRMEMVNKPSIEYLEKKYNLN